VEHDFCVGVRHCVTAENFIAGIEIPILKVSNPNQDYEVEKRIWQKQVRQRKKQAKENGEEPDLSDLPEPRRYPMKPVIVVIGR
jgi:hypothetical protein